LNDIKAEQCKSKEKNNNEKKFNNEKTANDDISNVKFANIISRESLKYVNLFINKILTIFCEETLYTILIVMIHLFMI
jgi:hypothetical protein